MKKSGSSVAAAFWASERFGDGWVLRLLAHRDPAALRAGSFGLAVFVGCD